MSCKLQPAPVLVNSCDFHSISRSCGRAFSRNIYLTVLSLVIVRFSILNSHMFIEKDLKSDLSLKNIIKNKEISEDILPSTDVHIDVQKQETGRGYPEEEGEFGEVNRIL